MERFTHLKKKKKGIEKKTLYTLSCAFHKQIIILIQGFFFFFLSSQRKIFLPLFKSYHYNLIKNANCLNQLHESFSGHPTVSLYIFSDLAMIHMSEIKE
jgi:hypothetical protein